MRKKMVKVCSFSLVLFFLMAAMSHFETAAFAGQSKSLAQLLDEFMHHRSSLAAATAVSDKMYELKEHGKTPDEATISKMATLLESADERIVYAGATAVMVLGADAWPIRLDVWKLYFRIVDEDAKTCAVRPEGNPILYDRRCFNRAFNPDELRWRVCSALISIGDIPSDKASWSRCSGLSN